LQTDHNEIQLSDSESDDVDEEDIVVTRKEEERDPEADAEFDRELAKMMADSLDSRKFERKPLFDVPLPMKRNVAQNAVGEADHDFEHQPIPAPAPTSTMAFSLLTKRGNKQQVCHIELLNTWMSH
jgi:regulator of nonsense transcripts 2